MSRLSVLGFGSALAAFCVAAYFASPTPVSARGYCFTEPQSQATLCDFDSLQQCQATSSGRGGSCFREPWPSESFSQASSLSVGKAKVRRAHTVQSH